MSEQRKPQEPWVGAGEMDCQAADLTATVSGEATLADVQKELARFDQWVPVDGDEQLPMGQLVEENSSGALRLGYGAWRDLLLGCQFRLARGELITAGGRTVKNVAGYDLTKFMVGQRGLFGKIVTLTMRTYKRPAAGLAARFEPTDQFVGKILATNLRPRWAILTAKELWCGWLDSAAAVEFFAGRFSEYRPAEIVRQTLEQDIAMRGRLWVNGTEGFRASVPPVRILEFAERGKLRNWSADAAFGIVRGNLSAENEEIIQRAAIDVGGSVYFFQPGRRPRWNASNEERAILGRLAAAFGVIGWGG
ncbi:MAG: FAD-binding oxidoreductase [Tepidisphaeraceae bacterium]